MRDEFPNPSHSHEANRLETRTVGSVDGTYLVRHDLDTETSVIVFEVLPRSDVVVPGTSMTFYPF